LRIGIEGLIIIEFDRNMSSSNKLTSIKLNGILCIYMYIVYDGERNFLSRYSLHDIDERQSA